jgi:hypothetical protein
MTAQDPRAAFAADLRRHAAVVATESIDSGLGDDDTFEAVTASCLMYAHSELTVGDLRSAVDLGIADALEAARAAGHPNVL